MTAKRFLPFVLVSVLCLSISCGEKIEPGTTSTEPARVVKAPVAVAKVTRQPYLYEAVGTVMAQTVSTLSGKLMGTVKAVHVREGDPVKPGDVLVVIDDRQVTAQLNRARSALAEARKAESAASSARDAALAGAEFARATHQRYLRLMKDASASRQEYEEIEARRRQADAALRQAEAMMQAARHRSQQAQAAVTAAQISQKDAKIIAPYSGIVTAKIVEEGDMAAPGMPLLTVEKRGDILVNVVIPEAHIDAIASEQALNITISALQAKPLTGIVKTIVPAADPQSRSFIVKVRLPENPAIRSGMFARVEIPLGENHMLLIPSTAVVVQGQLTGIYLVDAEGIARFRLIRTGRKIGDVIEVISGLLEGTRYVVAPPPTLADGVQVEVSS